MSGVKKRLKINGNQNIININMPPLRDRKEDIVELATHFVRHYRKAFRKEIDFLPNNILDLLLQHDWPGNVRELENVIQRAVLMAKGNMITEQELVFDDGSRRKSRNDYFGEIVNSSPPLTLKDAVAKFESDVISHVLREVKGNVVEAAMQLDIGKTALYDKIKRFKISPKLLKSN